MFAMTGCGKGTTSPSKIEPVSGGRSAILSLRILMDISGGHEQVRNAAPLGIYVAEYLSRSPLENAAQGGVQGVAIQSAFMEKQQSVSDPDFDLIQAFADALQVDVPDLLNRSTDRQQSLETYTQALINVATRANERFKELSTLLTTLTNETKQLNKEKTDAERTLKKALDSKDFSAAGDQQKLVLEKQQAYAESELKRKQTEGVVNTLDKFLTLFGQKILAIQQNREVLIAGNKVVSVPGIDELQLLQKSSSFRKASGTSPYDSLFQGQ
jgi:hypothetical protein